MHLLLSRSQSDAYFSLIPLRFGRGVIFEIKAELDIDQEESALLKKYNFINAVLVPGNRFQALRRAALTALLVGIIAQILSIVFFVFSYGAQGFLASMGFVPISILIVLGMTVAYYFEEREHVLVKHFLDGGRVFRCDSVIELIRKEADIEGWSQALRQVLESAKQWHDREALSIPPLDKEAARQFVLRLPRA